MTGDDAETLRLRNAELQTALDRVQSAALQARAEADHYRGKYETAQEDINGFVNEIRDLHDQLDRARGELNRRGARP